MSDLYEIKTMLDDTTKTLTQVLSTVAKLLGWVVHLLELLDGID